MPIAQRLPGWPSCVQRPMWWDSPTTPGRIASVAQTRATKWPISVVTRTRSPVRTPILRASPALNHSGWVLEISLRYLAFPTRVWIRVGSRKFGISTNSSSSRSMRLAATCDSMYPGVAYSGQPQSASVVE